MDGTLRFELLVMVAIIWFVRYFELVFMHVDYQRLVVDCGVFERLLNSRYLMQVINNVGKSQY